MKRRSSWWMYFIQGEHSGNIKIGIATCPYNRVDKIQAVCTERLTILGIARIAGETEEDARDSEAQIHRHFEAQRLYGEIFSPSKHLLKVAKAKRIGSDHECSRCSGSPAIRKRKPIAVSIESKERHDLCRLKNRNLHSRYHKKLPYTFFPRRNQDEYGGTVRHLRKGVSITTYSNRADRYVPSLG